MAQPLQDGCLAFVLGLFGTDNKFDSDSVLHRWQFMEREALRVGITLLGFSSDGDPKLLRAMKLKSFEPNPNKENPWNGWFGQGLDPTTVCIQDTIHVGTKLRTRFCKPGRILTIGESQASVTHLESMIDTFDKINHGLTRTDIDSRDKMNFPSVLKITSERVLKELRKQPDGEGTEMFLTLIQHVLDAYMDPKLLADDRIFLLWRVGFFLRLWRSSLIDCGMSLEEHFITQNTYECIEVNAHALINLIRRLRDAGCPEHLILPLISSQACEKAFRAARSMTTVFATVINFDLLQMIGRLRRIELQTYVVDVLGDEFTFPRYEKKITDAAEQMGVRANTKLPTDEEILLAIDRARSEAKEWAALFSIHAEEDDEIACPVQVLLMHTRNIVEDEDDEEECVNEPDVATPADQPEFDPDDVALVAVQERIQQGQSAEVENFAPDSPWVYYTKQRGAKVPINKTTLCWLLATGREKLSSDRLLRVQQSENIRRENRPTATTVTRGREIGTGEWCAWQDDKHGVIIGRVLMFKYLTGAGRHKVYSLPTAPVSLPTAAGRRGLGCVCTFFKLSPDGVITRYCRNNSNMIEIEQYQYSLPPPQVVRGNLKLAQEVVSFITIR